MSKRSQTSKADLIYMGPPKVRQNYSLVRGQNGGSLVGRGHNSHRSDKTEPSRMTEALVFDVDVITQGNKYIHIKYIIQLWNWVEVVVVQYCECTNVPPNDTLKKG